MHEVTVFLSTHLRPNIRPRILDLGIETYGGFSLSSSDETKLVFGFENINDAKEFYDVITEVYKLKAVKKEN